MIENNLITLIIIILVLNSLFIGYLFGRSASNNISYNEPRSFFQKQHNQSKEKNSICIDDTKFVTDIKTDGLEKKYDKLGDVKTSSENIASSVNKLKNLKR